MSGLPLALGRARPAQAKRKRKSKARRAVSTEYNLLLTATLCLLAFGAVIWLAGGQLTTPQARYHIYFSGPVSGLREGAAVEYNGLPVGKVEQLRIDADERQVGRDVQPQRVPRQPVAQVVHRRRHCIGQIDRLERQPQPARLDPHHVEQVADEAV